MESRLLEGWIGDALEAQVEDGTTRNGQSGLESSWLVGQPLASERRFPEPAQRSWLDGVDDDVLEIHALNGRSKRYWCD